MSSICCWITSFLIEPSSLENEDRMFYLFSMKSFKAYLDLCRISNLPTVWTNVLAAVVLSYIEVFPWSSFIILSLSLSFFYSGGMCLNDLWDVAVDRFDKPFRPLPSQRISIKGATLFTLVLFGVALSLLLLVPSPRALCAGFFLLALIGIYNRIHKRYSFSVFLMAACRWMVFIVSGIA